MSEIELPLQSLTNTIPFSVRDWSLEKRDAWVYGIVLGWDDDCFEEFHRQFSWNDETWQRLKRLHIKFKQLEKLEKAQAAGQLVELPRKVGSEVYSYCSVLGRVGKYKITTITLFGCNNMDICAGWTENGEALDEIDFDISDIGKTVFLTRAEAEAALGRQKGLNENAD